MATATAVGGVAYPNTWRAMAAAADIPSLTTDATITGIAAGADRMIAVGGYFAEDAPEPSVWSYEVGASSWTQVAGAGSFPPLTALRGVAPVGQSFVACGYTLELARTLVIVADSTGQVTSVPIYAMRPALFLTLDGSPWEPVTSDPGTMTLGAWTAATNWSDGRALIVGASHLEPGVSESYDLHAISSPDGRNWSPVSLRGVAPLQHGSLLLAAGVLDQIWLATIDRFGTSLYAGVAEAWTAIRAPEDRVGFVAAGAVGDSILLAGVTEAGEPRYWKRTAGAWADASADVAAFAGNAIPRGFAEFGGATVVALSGGSADQVVALEPSS